MPDPPEILLTEEKKHGRLNSRESTAGRKMKTAGMPGIKEVILYDLSGDF